MSRHCSVMFQLGFGPQGVQQNSSQLLCYICGKSGHSTMKCFHQFDLSFNGASSSSYSTDFIPSPSSEKDYLASPSMATNKAWYMDSGATYHVTSQDNAMSEKTEYIGSRKLVVGNGDTLTISHIGSITLPTSRSLILKNLLLIPSIKKNLISISKFTSNNDVIVEFNSSSYCVKEKLSKTTLLTGTFSDGLYQLDFSSLSPFPSLSQISINTCPIACHKSITPSSACSFYNKTKHVISLWHKRLGHLNSK